MAVPLVASLREHGYESRVKFSTFITTVDAAVRRECAAANVRLVDHASAEWTCGGYSVALDFIDDAFRITIDHSGMVIYQNVDTWDEESARKIGAIITKALNGALV